MPVSSIDVNLDYSKLASGGRDVTTRVWDIETSKCISKREIARNLCT